MTSHRTTYRVIYGDTDKMGVVYYGNYMRWFEIGRGEMLRDHGFTYESLEERGYFLPVSEVHCKYISSAKYDELIIIETAFDPTVKAAMKFDYRIERKDSGKLIATGYTRHACIDTSGKVIRPPAFLRQLFQEKT